MNSTGNCTEYHSFVLLLLVFLECRNRLLTVRAVSVAIAIDLKFR